MQLIPGGLCVQADIILSSNAKVCVSAKTGSYISENALDAWSLIGFRLQGIPHRGGFLKTEDSKFVDHVAPVSEDDMAELSAVFDAASVCTI